MTEQQKQVIVEFLNAFAKVNFVGEKIADSSNLILHAQRLADLVGIRLSAR